jgi:sulfite exporter TauE/SafE
MSVLPLAFLLGLMGSLHCAVMCGPIMLSLPLPNQGGERSVFAKWSALGQLVLYQLGRVLTYTVLGVIVGVVGSSVTILIKQETFSFVLGFCLIAFTILYLTGKRLSAFANLQLKLIAPISSLMGRLYGMPFWGFFAGMLNGVIPCGMVYLALATALGTGSIQSSAKFMCLFGLGTMPLMLVVSLGGIYLKGYFRFNSAKLIPWVTILVGVLFMMRSASLGIPFLSPNLQGHHKTTVAECR